MEAFTGVIVADVKTDASKSLPSWIEQERAQAVASLKVNQEDIIMPLASKDQAGLCVVCVCVCLCGCATKL